MSDDLLGLVLAGHGGLRRWQRVRRLEVTVSARGALFAAKGHPDGLRGVQWLLVGGYLAWCAIAGRVSQWRADVQPVRR